MRTDQWRGEAVADTALAVAAIVLSVTVGYPMAMAVLVQPIKPMYVVWGALASVVTALLAWAAEACRDNVAHGGLPLRVRLGRWAWRVLVGIGQAARDCAATLYDRATGARWSGDISVL